MSIEFVRIDDRLVHGQVVTTWLKKYDIEQVIIVNDSISEDKTRQSILKISAPVGLKIVFFSVSRFVEILNTVPIKKKTMVIYTNPKDVYDCIAGGMVLEYLNVGQMSKTDDNEKVTGGVALGAEDKVYFQKIVDKGTRVEIQMVPNDKITRLEKYL
ncbi:MULTISPECIES: PTS sugar transporter subunit IIB [unclassified Streptococcus]|uniref:PTS sugar transporter subunit IIB n=1 Tax=unclassified Streptococcus TaxID=2608887 RepID=UPI001071E0B2|nr:MULTISPECIES: PTS sugar transporter subunit IIB [unclassified Streptococcus]MBF0787310.1 PTS sugar transporter subunit IIB [Streptococcus sp. 19428wC2_LYSM12]MCQ9212649.1 PTS sugar transporter subunit IIB [Streptococcus sp. B01]MCQ9213988.1 PTS sugar transporter subunit IIB [Streptococcus sp. O1]TFV05797.1 PTS mannose/fructose/sorbose transporter subunit IIB [Streptococcus sp. LYSM12]